MGISASVAASKPDRADLTGADTFAECPARKSSQLLMVGLLSVRSGDREAQRSVSGGGRCQGDERCRAWCA